MTDKERDSALNNRASGNTQGYILIALYVLLLYIITIPFYIKFNKTVLPMGDPFTYTVGWFMKLDAANDDWYLAFKTGFMGNWYWLMNLMILIFSPLLVKEPFSIALVNYVMWGIATASVYRLVRHLGFNEGFAFIAALLVWFLPINYGFMTYESVPVLGLDSMFVGALLLFTTNFFYFTIEPEKSKNALIAGVCTGLAIWARGFSITVISMIAFCPMLFLAYRVFKERNYRIILNILLYIAVSALLTIPFFKIMGAPLAEYYGHFPDFVSRFKLDWAGVMYWLKNIPGFYFLRHLDSWVTISIGIFCHLLIFLSIYLAIWRAKNLPAEKRISLQIIALSSAFIYWVTYIINIVLWHYPYFTVYNCMLQYSPMRIAITFSCINIAAYIVLMRGTSIKRWTMVPMLFFGVIYGEIATQWNTPQPVAGIPSPQEVEALAKDFDRLTNGGTVSMLWYRHYNPAILNYYRIKNSLPPIKFFKATQHYDRFWYANYSEDDRLNIREELKHHFDEANIIIIGEYLDYYGSHYVIYHFSDEIAKYLNSPDSPRFVVRMILSEYDNQNILVLQREKDSPGQGEPLQLPYGFKKDHSHSEYGNGVVKYKLDPVKCTNTILDQGIFFEKVGTFPHAVDRKCNMAAPVTRYSVGAGPKEHAAHIRMPVAWKLQGSNDKSQWTDLDVQEGQADWADDEARVFDIATPGTYQFYRLLTTAGVDPSVVRLYKFDLNPTYNTTKNSRLLMGGMATASTPNAKKLVDGIIQPTSMWDAGVAGWWKYDFGPETSRVIYQYVMYGWDSSINAPTEWTFDGSNDDVNWTVLDAQSKVLWKDGEIKTFTILKPSAYRYYRLNVTAPGRGLQARLMELKMIELSSDDDKP